MPFVQINYSQDCKSLKQAASREIPSLEHVTRACNQNQHAQLKELCRFAFKFEFKVSASYFANDD